MDDLRKISDEMLRTAVKKVADLILNDPDDDDGREEQAFELEERKKKRKGKMGPWKIGKFFKVPQGDSEQAKAARFILTAQIAGGLENDSRQTDQIVSYYPDLDEDILYEVLEEMMKELPYEGP